MKVKGFLQTERLSHSLSFLLSLSMVPIYLFPCFVSSVVHILGSLPSPWSLWSSLFFSLSPSPFLCLRASFLYSLQLLDLFSQLFSTSFHIGIAAHCFFFSWFPVDFLSDLFFSKFHMSPSFIWLLFCLTFLRFCLPIWLHRLLLQSKLW